MRQGVAAFLWMAETHRSTAENAVASTGLEADDAAMDALTLFGLLAVSVMLVTYAFEERSPGSSQDLPWPANWARSTAFCRAHGHWACRGNLVGRRAPPSVDQASGAADADDFPLNLTWHQVVENR